MYKHFFKRFFDFWVALFFVLLSSPLLLVTAIWLHFANKGAGAWFLQERPGLHGKIFKIGTGGTGTCSATIGVG